MIEQLSPASWERCRGVLSDTYVFVDFDGRAVGKLDESTFSEKRRLQWRVPVLIGTRGADAFWWYRDAAFRCGRGLAWWDVEALAGGDEAPPSIVRRPMRHAASAPRPERAARSFGLLGRHVRKHGAAATYRQIAERLRPHIYLDEAHVWSVLTLASPTHAPALGEGLRLTRGDREDIDLLDELSTTVSAVEARRRLDDGVQLWLVKDGSEAAFVCWIFTESAPMVAAPGGHLRLPPRHAVLEDTATGEAYRGQGIAPAAWLAVAERLRAAGQLRMLTKVDIDNAPSRRAVEKAGFSEAATVYVRRIAGRNSVTVEPMGSSEVAAMLRERLG